MGTGYWSSRKFPTSSFACSCLGGLCRGAYLCAAPTASAPFAFRGLRVPYGHVIRIVGCVVCITCIVFLELNHFLVAAPAVKGTEQSGDCLVAREGGSVDQRAVQECNLVQETGH